MRKKAKFVFASRGKDAEESHKLRQPPPPPPPFVGGVASGGRDDSRSSSDGDVGAENSVGHFSPLEESDDDADVRLDAGLEKKARNQLYRLKKRRESKRILAIEQAWDNNIFGILEKRLNHLCKVFNVFALNAEAFDLILLYAKIICYCKSQGPGREVSIQKEGAKIRYLKIGSIRLTDIKRLLAGGTSLDSFGKMCGLDIQKSIFPFEKFTSRDYLSEPCLPSDAQDWASRLNPEKSPTQKEVDEALKQFREEKMSCVGDFLKKYLLLDVKILLRSIVAMAETYYKILKIDFTDSGLFTVSSLASLGAAHYLARNKKPAMFHCQHARTYRVGSFFH
jgi:hypothetical protein